MLNACAKLIALFWLIVFVVVTPIILLMLNVDRQLLASDIYKRALADQNVYARLPALAAENLMRVGGSNPCAENPNLERCQGESPSPPSENLVIQMIAAARGEPQNCLQQSLGKTVYAALANAQRQPSATETDLTKACLKKFGVPDAVAATQGSSLMFWFLDQSDFEALLAALLSPAWLQSQSESVLDQTFAFLDARTDAINLSLTDLKSRLQAEGGAAILLRLLRAQPPCTPEQLRKFTALGASAGKNEPAIVCRPPEDVLSAMMPDIQKRLSQVVADLPDQINLAQNLPASRATTGAANSPFDSDWRQTIAGARLLLRLSFGLLLGLLFLIALFGARSRKGLFRWWGAALLIVGLLVAGIAALIWVGLDVGVAKIANDFSIPLPFTPELKQIALGVAAQIGRTFDLWIGVEAGALSAMGLLFLMIAMLFRKNRARETG